MGVTNQERINDVTMTIENPNVVGSGFIRHPPQKRFQGKIIQQPLTCAKDYEQTVVGVAPQAQQQASYHNGAPASSMYSQHPGGYNQQQQQQAYGMQQQQQQYQQRQAPQQYQTQSVQRHAGHANVQTVQRPVRTHFTSVGGQQQQQQRGGGQHTHRQPVNNPPAAAVVQQQQKQQQPVINNTNPFAPEGKEKLSKSQRKRLRKKIRDNN